MSIRNNPIIIRLRNFIDSRKNIYNDSYITNRLNRLVANKPSRLHNLENILHEHKYYFPKEHAISKENINQLRKLARSKFNKYVNEVKKIAESENVRVNVNSKNHRVTLSYGPGNKTYVRTRPHKNNEDYMHIELGMTDPNLRGRGIGKQLRAIVTLAAGKAGYKKVKQESAFINRNTVLAPMNKKSTKKGNVNNTGRPMYRYPPSYYVMQSLGFNVTNKTEPVFFFHEYNFNKKTSSNRQKLLNALVLSHPVSTKQK